MNPLRLTVVAAQALDAGFRRDEPVTFGLPFSRSLLFDPDTLSLVDAAGHRPLLQTRILDRWSDNSVRWLLVDTQINWSGAETELWLEAGSESGATRAAGAATISVRSLGESVQVDSGSIRVSFGPGMTYPFGGVTNEAGDELLNATSGGLRVIADDSAVCAVIPERIEIEESGPVRAAIRWRGRVAHDSNPKWLELDARVEVFAGSSAVRVGLTIRNPRAAEHPGNFWELGDPASCLIREAALVFSASAGMALPVECSLEHGQPMTGWDVPFEIYQESSGGEHWQSAAHVDRHGVVPMQLRGYRVVGGDCPATGLRASPVVKAGNLIVTTPNFWQYFPRSIDVDRSSVTVGLWPAQFSGGHELQGGEQKTHDVIVAFGPDAVSDIPLDWCRTPAIVRADPAWYCGTGVVAHVTAETSASGDRYGALVGAAVDGPDTFLAKRERIDEFGWRHFGDIYADHESALRPGDPPIVSHYNNQYDALAGFAIQFFRTGDVRWWAHMNELGAHAVDIDLYHAAADKSAYSGGPFWHTAHYVDAGRSTHRSYPRSPGVNGGGPSCEHNYSTGLLLHYFLTGNPRSREAVLQLADWVRQIDDGTRTPFRWLSRGDTGLASATRNLNYHGPGRGAAHSVTALLNAWQLTGFAPYRQKAEQLIRRCIHPRDDIDARHLLNAEDRWSYTVFLVVLGRYLDEMAERGERGDCYAWARDALLAYARWMAGHERPYLDRPEELEYPTETWAAQDMRKCEALLLGSLCASTDDERAGLRARAEFFFDSSSTTLMAMPTRTCARPVAILLSCGYRRAWFAVNPQAELPAADVDANAGDPRPFAPQRQRAIARAIGLLAAALLVTLVSAAALAGLFG